VQVLPSSYQFSVEKLNPNALLLLLADCFHKFFGIADPDISEARDFHVFSSFFDVF
jgi:hypothetical protein